MKDNYSVFEYHGYFKSSPNDIQYRYVCAESEEEADKLIEKYSDDLVSRGFDRFVSLGNPTVHIEGVIA